MTALYDHEADIDILSIEEEMRLLDPTRATELNGLEFIAVSSTTREAGDVSRQVLAGRPSMGKTTLHSYLTIIETFTSVKKRTKNKFKTFSYYTAILFNIFGNCMAKIIVQQIAAVASDIASAE